MRSNWIKAAFVSAAVGALPMGALQAQDAAPSPWAESAKPIVLEDSAMSGPGADWLAPRLSDAQSVLVGEQHGVDGLARFTAALEAEFQPDVLVLEAGPWIARRLTEAPAAEALADAPYSLAFDYNGDIALIEQFQDRRSERALIWGVDQEANAIHPYAWLAENAQSGVVQRTARGLHAKAAFDAGEYTRRDHQADLDRLSTLAGDDAVTAAVIDHISTTMNIFVTWRSGARSEAAVLREQYMIDNYDAGRAAFETQTGQTPRALFKMGGAHILEGETGPNGVMTLGEHIQRRADADNASALHLGVRGYSPEHTTYPIADLIEGQPLLLLDTAPLRAALEAGALPDLTEDERADLYGFDALVYLNPAARASKSQISALQGDFRTGLLTALGLSFWPAALLIAFSLGGIGLLIARALRGGAAVTGPMLTLTAVSAITLTVFALQLLALVSNSAGAAGPGPALLPYLAPVLAIAAFGDTALRGRTAGLGRFIAGLVWAGLLVWLAMGVHRWNFGGMLG